MNSHDLAEFRIEVRPSPETNDHEVCLLADGENLIERFSSGKMGMDPNDLLTEPCPLRADVCGHGVCIGRCSCGDVGCGSLGIQIRRDRDQVLWTASGSPPVRFLATQYNAEVERALRDYTWETPERTAARLISRAVDRSALARRGFEFSWASGRCMDGVMTASLVLTPGPYQVLVNVPWNGQDIESVVSQFKLILGQSPEVWPNVSWSPQAKGLGPPPITGPGW